MFKLGYITDPPSRRAVEVLCLRIAVLHVTAAALENIDVSVRLSANGVTKDIVLRIEAVVRETWVRVHQQELTSFDLCSFVLRALSLDLARRLDAAILTRGL